LATIHYVMEKCYDNDVIMKSTQQDKFQSQKNNLFFGSTAAIITNLGLLIGLASTPNAKFSIIGSMLVIGIADNISDTLGIHVYQEAEGVNNGRLWLYSLGNYAARLGISLLFVFLVAFLPMPLAIIYCLCSGVILISFISYSIARHNKSNPVAAIIEHLGVALVVIIISRILGSMIKNNFKF
jgi:vacuolar iron transporter family protein